MSSGPELTSSTAGRIYCCNQILKPKTIFLAKRGSPYITLGIKNETAMILEVATLNVHAGESEAFEHAFSQAQNIISSIPGYVSHQLQRCLESQDKYLLLVQWQKLEDHTIGFRQSRQYQDWKKLSHDFYVEPM